MSASWPQHPLATWSTGAAQRVAADADEYSDPGAVAAIAAGLDPTGELHTQLLAFLHTATGLSWLKSQLGGRRDAASWSVQDLNRLLLSKVHIAMHCSAKRWLAAAKGLSLLPQWFAAAAHTVQGVPQDAHWPSSSGIHSSGDH